MQRRRHLQPGEALGPVRSPQRLLPAAGGGGVPGGPRAQLGREVLAGLSPLAVVLVSSLTHARPGASAHVGAVPPAAVPGRWPGPALPGGERAPLTPGLPWEAVLVYHAWGGCGKAQAAGDPGARWVCDFPPTLLVRVSQENNPVLCLTCGRVFAVNTTVPH